MIQRASKPRSTLVALSLALVISPLVVAQQPPPQGGASTSGVFPARRDAQGRAITAGGFVDGAPIYFEDATARSGLDTWIERSGGPQKRYIIETTSGGVALFDFDNDGWLDVYLVNGGTIEALKGKQPMPKAALFRNKRDGTFEDVTEKAGVANERWGMGVASGDFDNDGWADLYVTNFGVSRLYRNKGNGTFEDVAVGAGVTFDGWASGAAFGDYDADGQLDLFVAGYIDFDVNNPPEPGPSGSGYNFCSYRGVTVMCGPRGLKGAQDRLYRNKGGGKFEDVSVKAGVSDTARYYGFGVAWFDANNDGRLDLAVANDSVPNYLYVNKGDGTFEDLSLPSGFALSENGREQACMGLAVGDVDNDGRDELFVTNFSDDSDTLYHNDGDATFTDVTVQSGIHEPTFPFLAWGAGLVDIDNDGKRDIFIANGHVYPDVDKHDWGMTWAMRPLVFRNRDGKRFDLLPAAPGSGLAVVKSARGAAFGDIDNDGDLDVVMNNIDEKPTLLLNRAATGNHWLQVRVVGRGKVPSDGIGTVVVCTIGTQKLRGRVASGESFQSQSDLRVHFGLGKATKIDKLEVFWPDGAVDRVAVDGVDRVVTVTRASGGSR
jgi:enediyne biosynthesis protein E4